MMSQTMTSIVRVLSSLGDAGSGNPQVMTINNSTFTTSRLSGSESLPLLSRMTVNPVNSDLNETVVNCFEGTSSTESAATTSIRIIDPHRFGKIM